MKYQITENEENLFFGEKNSPVSGVTLKTKINKTSVDHCYFLHSGKLFP